MASEHLRFSPDILERLGEELIPHPDQGVIELARNAYDADASRCTVRLRATAALGGSILVEDDGDGMSLDAIHDGWLLLGRSSKSVSERTRLGRLPVGDKGPVQNFTISEVVDIPSERLENSYSDTLKVWPNPATPRPFTEPPPIIFVPGAAIARALNWLSNGLRIPTFPNPVQTQFADPDGSS